MKCGCGGEINTSDSVSLKTGCRSSTPAFPCSSCGLLHFVEENEKIATPAENQRKQKAYLEKGEIVLK
jgi:hypothetical protein